MTGRDDGEPRRTNDAERARSSDDDVQDGILERDTWEHSVESETQDRFMGGETQNGFPESEASDESAGTEELLSSSPGGETAFACRQCDVEISRMADECPECGYDPAGTARDVAAVILAFGVVLTIAVPPAGVFALFVGVVLVGWSFLRTPAGRGA